MIPPSRQWCIQIEVTNACTRRCANCTRLVAHAREPFFMDTAQFACAVEALRDFPSASEPDGLGRSWVDRDGKVVGIMGGEPLLHPDFDRLCAILSKAVPRQNRGLWTGVDVARHPRRDLILSTFRYINENTHRVPSMHAPVLAAVSDLIRDPQERNRLIDQCWLQEMWSSSINPRGFFFCEVAGAMSMIAGGPDGEPVEPGCWRKPLEAYRRQVDHWCPKCGICLYDRAAGRMAVPGLGPRVDRQLVDDVSPSNYRWLTAAGSPRIAKGEYAMVMPPFEGEYDRREPWRYGG